MTSDDQRLLDVQEAIERIHRYTQGGRATFEADELVQIWVVHHLQIIGEALRAVSPELRARHPEVPWTQIIGLRNILVHSYSYVETDRVWNVVEQHLPALERQIAAILDKLGEHP